MQQRRLRLGDILDDYCPRERRITNHTVVAMVEDEIKQTRCTACEADHEYKNARVPPPRRKRSEAPAAERPEALVPRLAEDDAVQDDAGQEAGEPHDQPGSDAPSAAEADAAIESVLAAVEGTEDDGPVHRRLIRATLPRPEGQAPERREPDFTIRQQGGRGGREADGNRAGGGFGQGRRPGRPHGQQAQRFGSGRGPRQGDGSGQGRGNQEGRPGGSGGNRPGGGSGRRRRRGR
jgi:hypothetical protein